MIVVAVSPRLLIRPTILLSALLAWPRTSATLLSVGLLRLTGLGVSLETDETLEAGVTGRRSTSPLSSATSYPLLQQPAISDSN